MVSGVVKLRLKALTCVWLLFPMVFIHLLLPDPFAVPVSNLIPTKLPNLLFNKSWDSCIARGSRDLR